jgi:hypothetical protein
VDSWAGRRDRVADLLVLRDPDEAATGRKKNRRDSDPVVPATAERDRTEPDDRGADQAGEHAVAAGQAALTDRPLARRSRRDCGEGHHATTHYAPTPADRFMPTVPSSTR